MGVKCKIIYNSDNTVDFVEAPNGSRSILFEDLKKLDLDDTDAINAWTVSTTESFKEDILNPKVNNFRMRTLNKLKSLKPKRKQLTLIVKGKEQKVRLSDIKFDMVQTPNFLTLNSNINGIKLGTIRIRPFRDGYQINNASLNEIQLYNGGSLGNIRNKGIGTEMYKELISSMITQGIPVYSSLKASPEAEGIWNKFRKLGIVETELVNGGRYYKINPNPSSLDKNGEPFAKDVLSYISNSNNESNLTLNEEERLQVKEAMLNTSFNSSEELMLELSNTFFPNGGFEVVRDELSKSNIYTPSEQKNILDDELVQNKIKDIYFKIKNSPVVNNDMFVDKNFITIENTDTNVIGKYKVVNPFIAEKEALKTLAGTNTREEFEEKLLESELDYLKENYFNNKFSEEDLFYKLSNYKLVEEKSIENGELVSNLDNDITELMQETLTDPSNTQLIEVINYVNEIPSTIWFNNEPEIKTLLKDLSSKAIDIGIDLVGIEEFYDVRSPEEFKQLFDAIDIFMNSQTEETFSNLTNLYKNFFGTTENISYRPVATESKNSIYLQTDKSAYELFSKFGLLPIDKNVYRIVNNSRPLDEVYNNVYLNVLQNPSILPRKAYESFALDNEGTLDRSILNKPENQSMVIQKMKDFVRSEIGNIDSYGETRDTEMLEKMYLYSSFFNTSLNNIGTSPQVEGEVNLIMNPISNQEYVTSDFISDFNKSYLREKLKNSELFKEFYSNFKVTSKGIKLINTDPITMTRLDIELQKRPDLKNHLLLQKDSPIKSDNSLDYVIEDELLMRNFYANYPVALKRFTEEYTVIDNNTVISKTPDNFIRVDQGLFEMSDSFGEFSVFKRIEENKSNYKTYSPQFTKPINDTDLSGYSIKESNEESNVDINNIYSTKQEASIDNKIDNCS